MASSIFNAGGGAGIGSYVIVFKDGILDPKTDFARLRGAYDSGDSIYLSLIGEGYDEALVPASGWVDEDDKLHLVARDFDDGKTYTIDLALNAHEAEVKIKDGIEIDGTKIAEGASVPEPAAADRGLFLKVSDQGELEYAEAGGGGNEPILCDFHTNENATFQDLFNLLGITQESAATGQQFYINLIYAKYGSTTFLGTLDVRWGGGYMINLVSNPDTTVKKFSTWLSDPSTSLLTAIYDGQIDYTMVAPKGHGGEWLKSNGGSVEFSPLPNSVANRKSVYLTQNDTYDDLFAKLVDDPSSFSMYDGYVSVYYNSGHGNMPISAGYLSIHTYDDGQTYNIDYTTEVSPEGCEVYDGNSLAHDGNALTFFNTTSYIVQNKKLVPATTTQDKGKLLTVDDSGNAEWSSRQDVIAPFAISLDQNYTFGKLFEDLGYDYSTQPDRTYSVSYKSGVDTIIGRLRFYQAYGGLVASFASEANSSSPISVTRTNTSVTFDSSVYDFFTNSSYISSSKTLINSPATFGDAGKVLTAGSYGQSSWVTPEKELPSSTSSDEGKALVINSEGNPAWQTLNNGGKIELAVENIATSEPTLNRWYELILGDYSLADFQEHKFVLTLNGMVMEEVGNDYVTRMNVRPTGLPDTELPYEEGFAFMGGDRIVLIDFYATGKDTFIGYGVILPAAAASVGEVNTVVNGYYDPDEDLSKQSGGAVVVHAGRIEPLMLNVGADQGQIAVTTLGEDFAQTGIGLYQSEGSAFAESSTLAEKGSNKDVSGPVTNRIEMRAVANGVIDGDRVHCDAHIKAQAQWQPGSKDADPSDVSYLEVRAPYVDLLAHQLTYARLDPVSGERVTEPAQVLFGKYATIIPTDYDISTMQFSDLVNVLPLVQSAYPALLLLLNDVYLEVRASVDVSNETIYGTIINLKSGFSASFGIQTGEIVEPSNPNVLLQKFLLPYHSPVANDAENYTTLDNTCVWPGSSHRFTSDITNLQLEEFYIKHDFSQVRINKSGTDYDGTKEFAVVIKNIYVGTNGAYGGKFWFYTPDGLHWVEIDEGVM